MYSLVNGVEQNKKYPETFEIPSEIERRNVRIGAYVKLLFEEKGKNSERMWVKVTAVDPKQNYEGTLSNDPTNLITIKFDDLVKFGPEHIIATEP